MTFLGEDISIFHTLMLLPMQGELFLSLENSTIFTLAIVGLLSAAACIHMITWTNHSTSQGEVHFSHLTEWINCLTPIFL